MAEKICIFLLMILVVPSLAVATGVGGGGSWSGEVEVVTYSCEDYCTGSKPYETYCTEDNACVFDERDRDAYMKSLDGDCLDYFDYGSEEWRECTYWWTDHYQEETLKYLRLTNWVLSIACVILVLAAILRLVDLFIGKESGHDCEI